ncbi:MAG: excinuclease ABC subunit UvrC [Pseudomonadota bacterium]
MPRPDPRDIEMMDEIETNDSDLEDAGPSVSGKVLAASLAWVGSDDSVADDGEKLRGADLIADKVKRLPNKPGVYRMLNADGDVLYVGKAKSLKNRVSSYARLGGHNNRIGRMIRLTVAMEFVTTQSETEALLLEANLIKRLRPRFNVLLRDDKSFPYIILTRNHPAPGLFKHRGAQTKKADYFGPFASAGAVGRTINAMQRAFLLRTCTDSVYESRTRPCLLYQIKRCSGPCTGEISIEDYGQLVDEATDFLRGKSRSVQAGMAATMQQAAEDLDFERAALYRDRIAALTSIQSAQGINPQTVEEADVFALHADGGQVCIQVFFFRTGQNWGNRAYFPRTDASMEAGEILGAFLSQFYDDKPVPKLILLSDAVADEPLLEEAFTLKAGHKVSINVPQRGEKRDLVKHAIGNAKEALGRRLAETSSQAKLMKGLAETFSLPRVPKRIEVYDNSHIMGTNAVGGMIVAGPEGFVKNQYRKFNIKNEELTPGDDFGMMREVMERRFSRLMKECGVPDRSVEDDNADNDAFPAWPDLLLIDGGLGQLNAVKTILDELGVGDAVELIGVAKGVDRDAGRERFFIPGRGDFSLPPRDPVLYFVQRLRDEAHRFAIGSHRARRKKALVKNPLDEIGGIGPSRKRALLHHFGTAKGVARATVRDLQKVDGISEAMAKTIHAHFNDGQNA